jgi:SAM-dependent MidA family methyltransferase
MNQAEYRQIAEYLHQAEQSKYSYDDIKARFEAEPASTYGETMAQWIPDFAYAHQLLLESLAVHLPAKARGVELGAGSGRVSKMLLQAFVEMLRLPASAHAGSINGDPPIRRAQNQALLDWMNRYV